MGGKAVSTIRFGLERASRWPAWPWWSVAIVVFWLGLVWVMHKSAPGTQLCTFKRVAGVPCPTCGLTRGVTAIVEEGDLWKGVTYNPLVMTAGILGLLVLGARLIAGWRPSVEMSKRERWITIWALVILFLGNWAYLIAYIG